MMKPHKVLRKIDKTLIEKDIDREKGMEEAELLLKVAAYMGPYAFKITNLPTHVLYEVNYAKVPAEIEEVIATAMETLHKSVESRYKKVCDEYEVAKAEVRTYPTNKWLIEKFNSASQLRTLFQVVLPSLKKKGKKAQ
jgi:hypothetical protein